MHCSQSTLHELPKRLYRALPSVLVGSLINSLDAVSLGVLVFPSGPEFASARMQGISMFIMSTLTSQLVLTVGGSSIDGALGSMLFEIMPFLRGIASDLSQRLGPDSQSLLPTVAAAFSLCSLLIGFVFTLMSIAKSGRLLEYIPRTVLTGAVGAIGVSLCLMALEISLPEAAGQLSMNNVKSALLSREHIPLLFASCLPAVVPCLTLRLDWLNRITRGATKHALFTPLYFLAIACAFWVGVVASGKIDSKRMIRLIDEGWLFPIGSFAGGNTEVGPSWNYWALFNFKNVEWTALGAAAQNIVLTVFVGVINLPIYIPALAQAIDVAQYSMNFELFGHGMANVLAGLTGTIPNLVVFSSSVFFIRAGGDRFAAWIVILFTTILFFISVQMLPYVPTVMASSIVLFFGIELLVGALYDSMKTLLWSEWLTVLGTVLACTCLGFAAGLAVGLAVTLFMLLVWTAIDSDARIVTLPADVSRRSSYQFHPCHESRLLGGKTSDDTDAIRLRDPALEFRDADRRTPEELLDEVPREIWCRQAASIVVIQLSGFLFFATIPMLERKLRAIKESGLEGLLVLDLTAAHRSETSVAHYILRKAREFARAQKPRLLCLAGLHQSSGLSSDLVRGGIECSWEKKTPLQFEEIACAQAKGIIQTFVTLDDARKSIEDSFPVDLGDVEEQIGRNVNQMLANRNETRSMIARSSHRKSVKANVREAKDRLLHWSKRQIRCREAQT